MARLLCKIAMILIAIYGIYQAVNIYQYFQQYPQTSFEWSTFGSMPMEAVIKSAMILQLKRTLVAGIIVWGIFAVADYTYKPEGHFFQVIHRLLKPLLDKTEKLEDDLEDEKDDGKNKEID